ncbi:MAG: GxxExxY protein [Thermodesulfobacteriota bacterium]|nr:GxxExxY protein [Thermodesulfobacteriota bacterium]
MVEFKLVEKLLPVHKKQLLTYLKITGIKLDEPVKSRKITFSVIPASFLSFRRKPESSFFNWLQSFWVTS